MACIWNPIRRRISESPEKSKRLKLGTGSDLSGSTGGINQGHQQFVKGESMAETITTLRARIAELEAENQQQCREWDALLDDTLKLHDETRHAWGVESLLTTYIRETSVVMQHLGNAQDNSVLKTLFSDLTARLKRQTEHCERAEARLREVLKHLEHWKGKVNA